MEKFAREREQNTERTDTLVWGKNAVTELLKSGGAVDTVYLTDTMPQAVAGYYTALSKESGAVVKRVPANKLQKMCGTPDHQGVAARAAEVEYKSLDELFSAAQEKGEPPFLVLCDGVEDPHNLGAIVRSAYLCGAHGVVIPKRGGVGVTGTVMKASAGAAARLPIARGALTRKLCDAAVTLEMAPGQATGVDSYNVSVAAGILCYDVMRRRLAKKQ